MVLKVSLNTGINRIRLEFKVIQVFTIPKILAPVLIESDWNLKQGSLEDLEANEYVLIESDWNLKLIDVSPLIVSAERINRIRLEFKATS